MVLSTLPVRRTEYAAAKIITCGAKNACRGLLWRWLKSVKLRWAACGAAQLISLRRAELGGVMGRQTAPACL